MILHCGFNLNSIDDCFIIYLLRMCRSFFGNIYLDLWHMFEIALWVPLTSELLQFLMLLDINTLSFYSLQKCFLSCCRFSFHTVDCFLCCWITNYVCSESIEMIFVFNSVNRVRFSEFTFDEFLPSWDN